MERDYKGLQKAETAPHLANLSAASFPGRNEVWVPIVAQKKGAQKRQLLPILSESLKERKNGEDRGKDIAIVRYEEKKRSGILVGAVKTSRGVAKWCRPH